MTRARYPRGKRFDLPVVEPARGAIRSILHTSAPGSQPFASARTAPKSDSPAGRERRVHLPAPLPPRLSVRAEVGGAVRAVRGLMVGGFVRAR